MSIAFITSMNENYYHRCGKFMIESFEKHLSNYTLNLYNEDFTPNHKINLIGWNLGDEYNKFAERWPPNSSIAKFAKKGFSIIHAMNHIECKYLIWLDADTIIQKSFDKELLKQITNKKNLSTHLSVYHEHNNKIYHSCETGFFCLNKTHPKFTDFKKIYTQIYTTDDTNNLRRFYDGEVYGETVNRLDQKYMNNLNPSEKYKTPIKHSILNDYILHYKGKSTKNKTFND